MTQQQWLRGALDRSRECKAWVPVWPLYHCTHPKPCPIHKKEPKP